MKKVIFFILLIPLAVFSPAQAEEKNNEEAIVTMAEVVVTATRDTQEIRKAPANVTVIDEKEINDSGATTVVEVLNKLESIQFTTFSSNSSQAYVDMRGFGGDNPYGKVLILLDGRRLNRPDMASINWMQMPVNSIEKIEVVRGPSAVLYGDAAIGGVINIITKKGKGEPKFNASVIMGSYGLHNERIGITGAKDKWTYALTGENNFCSGYRERSRYSAQGGGVGVGFSAGDLLNLSLGVSFNRVDYQMPGALTKEQMDKDRRQYQPDMPDYFMNAHSNDDGSDKYTNVNFGIKSFWGSFGRFEVNLLYGRKDLQGNIPSWYSYNYSDTYADTYGVTPRYILENDIIGFHNKVIVGVDYYYEPYEKEFYSDRRRTIKTSKADLERESIGGYIRDEFSILKSLILSAGYRFEETSIEGSNEDFSTPANDFTDQKNTYNAKAYEAGLTWLFGEKSKIFAKWSNIYRIPFLEEVAYFNGGGGGFLKSLNKEKGISMEAGTEFYPLENLRIGLNVFRIDMEDEIQYVGYYPTGYNQNTGKTRHDGGEVSLIYILPKYFKFFGNYTYHRATFELGANNKKEMPLVPKNMANAGLEIYLPFNIMIRSEVKYVDKSFLSGDNDNNTEKLNDYTLLNIYVYYRPSFGKFNITTFFGADNITNVKYSSFGLDYEQFGMPNFYYPMPGITFKGGISIDF